MIWGTDEKSPAEDDFPKRITLQKITLIYIFFQYTSYHKKTVHWLIPNVFFQIASWEENTYSVFQRKVCLAVVFGWALSKKLNWQTRTHRMSTQISWFNTFRLFLMKPFKITNEWICCYLEVNESSFEELFESNLFNYLNILIWNLSKALAG